MEHLQAIVDVDMKTLRFSEAKKLCEALTGDALVTLCEDMLAKAMRGEEVDSTLLRAARVRLGEIGERIGLKTQDIAAALADVQRFYAEAKSTARRTVESLSQEQHAATKRIADRCANCHAQALAIVRSHPTHAVAPSTNGAAKHEDTTEMTFDQALLDQTDAKPKATDDDFELKLD